mgnify:CR=1 FL=1
MRMFVELRDFTRAAEEARRGGGTAAERAAGEVAAGRIYRDHARNKLAAEAARLAKAKKFDVPILDEATFLTLLENTR